MSLEGVKVGDRVWVEQTSFSGVTSRRLLTVTGLTPQRIRVGKDQWARVAGPKSYHRAGRSIGSAWGWIKGVATEQEIAEYEAEQAAKKAAAEAVEAGRQQAYQEKCGRLQSLADHLEGTRNGEVVHIGWDGHRYEIREIE